MLRVTVTLSYCIVHAYVDVDDDEVYGSVVTYMNTNTYYLGFFSKRTVVWESTKLCLHH